MIYKTGLGVLLIFSSLRGICNPILGGQMYHIEHYTQGNIGFYTIGLDLYTACTNNPDSLSWPSLFPASVSIAVYRSGGGTLYTGMEGIRLAIVKLVSGEKLPECVVDTTRGCYLKATYTFGLRIPVDPEGFDLVYESCCRTANATNISGNQGYTITYKIVETRDVFEVGNYFADHNNTAICANTPFSLPLLGKKPAQQFSDFSYHLVPAYGSTIQTEHQTVISKGLPYVPLVYNTAQNYNGYFPLGSGVRIDTLTGILSGIAPGPGDYLINVLIIERIPASVIYFTKQFILKVRSCKYDAADLDPVKMNCNSLDVSFVNQSTNTNISSVQWQFLRGDTLIGSTVATSPNFSFPDTGNYTVKLKVTSATGCQDSALQSLRLYPLLKAGFTVQGNCILHPYAFTDTSATTFGSIQSRHWDFGDAATSTDTAVISTPVYKYDAEGTKTVRLIVTNTLGCIDTLKKTLAVTHSPPLLLSTHDTIICSIDTLTLQANGQGAISWSPAYNISGMGSASPFVFPKKTTSYIATLNANGCINTDSVIVQVLDYISITAGADLSVCAGDSVQIITNSEALSYSWFPASGLSNTTVKSPVAAPGSHTQYIVTANLGKCQAKDTVLVNVYPYPVVHAGIDTLICAGTKAVLRGSANASVYRWSPTPTLSNSASLNPTAVPTSTTAYVLTGYQQNGCTKPVSDTVVVTVTANLAAVNAGRDTSVVIGQALQLHASGGTTYSWSPATGLSDPNIPDPVLILSGNATPVKYTVTATSAGCKAQDEIVIRVFDKQDIYVPSAFTPNGDGKNDELRAIPVGIKTFLGFDIYGRWGNLVFRTTDPSKGWDGRINGIDQPIGAYVYIARGIDYLGNLIEKKGTITIIR